MEFVLEPSEGATPPDRAGQSPARPVVTDPVCEVSHVLVPHIGRQRVDADQVDIVQINGMLAINPAVLGPQRDLPAVRIDQPAMLEIPLVTQRRRKFVQVHRAQIDHLRSRAHDRCDRR